MTPFGRPTYNHEGLTPRRNPTRKGVIRLSEVRMMEGESFEGMLRRFNKRVQQDGVISEARRRAHFEPPSVTRKKKEAAKRRKSHRSTFGRRPVRR